MHKRGHVVGKEDVVVVIVDMVFSTILSSHRHTYGQHSPRIRGEVVAKGSYNMRGNGKWLAWGGVDPWETSKNEKFFRVGIAVLLYDDAQDLVLLFYITVQPTFYFTTPTIHNNNTTHYYYYYTASMY